MSRAKTERLVNLTVALMATASPLPVDRIGALIEGYDPQDGEAFRRMFERDKEDLRELGVPVETHTLPDGSAGYRISRRDYALPAVSFDPEEAAALGLAARLWSSASLARAGESALRKLAAGGVEPGEPPPDLDARVDATEPAFAPLLAASVAAREVAFDYRPAGAAEPATRHLQPWGLASWHGRWYVAGQDLDRAAPRVFRLSRVTGEVRTRSGPGAFARPEDLDLAALVAETEPVIPVGQARLWLAAGAAHALRRGATERGPAAGSAGTPGGDEVTVPFADLDRFADRVVGHGPDVVVLAPPELRDAVVARLRSVLR